MPEAKRLHLNIKPAIFKWQAKHERRLTYEEISQKTGIPIASLYRLIGNDLVQPDLHNLYLICNLLECTPGDIITMPED